MARTDETPARRQVRFFVRDDDVGDLTDSLKRFVETFAALAIPVSYQIIPARLTQACATFLLAAEREHPGLIEFGQHGLRHEMTLRGRRLKREFGPERSLEAQSADIVEGRDLLQLMLGPGRVIDQFTPPQHKFDRSTVRAAAAAGHRIFSGAAYASPHHRLAYAIGRGLSRGSILHHGISYHGRRRPEADIADVSIAIAVDDGRAIRCDADALDAAIARAERFSRAVGLMFHHDVYNTPEGPAKLRALAERLASYDPKNFRRLSDVFR